jgi:hypothetical protein
MCLQKKTNVFLTREKEKENKTFMCLIGDACIINGSKYRQLAAFIQASPIIDKRLYYKHC